MWGWKIYKNERFLVRKMGFSYLFLDLNDMFMSYIFII